MYIYVYINIGSTPITAPCAHLPCSHLPLFVGGGGLCVLTSEGPTPYTAFTDG